MLFAQALIVPDMALFTCFLVVDLPVLFPLDL